jgi:hypothetical protein
VVKILIFLDLEKNISFLDAHSLEISYVRIRRVNRDFNKTSQSSTLRVQASKGGKF